MATYRNSNDDEVIYLGSEFKLKVHMDPMNNNTMDDVDFKCTFYTNNSRKVTIDKSNVQRMFRDDANNYIAILDSSDLGKGTLTVVYEADIPDEHFDYDGDEQVGMRHETVVIPTKLKIK